MPVRSLTSSVLSWPEQATVQRAASAFARELKKNYPEVQAVGYFGSYARGDWGVGSDLDLLVIAQTSAEFSERSYSTNTLPVACDVIVYTPSEWRNIQKQASRWSETLKRELIWLA